MRTLMLALVAVAGCTSPRTKDCSALLPLLEETRASRDLATVLGDAGLAKTKLAERPKRAADAVRAVTLRDDAMKAPVFRLVDAMDRYVAAMTSLDELVAALHLSPTSASRPADVERALDDARPHVERLTSRCVANKQPAPECADLQRALVRCVTPDGDDVTAEEQLLTCATTVEKVSSNDPATAESIAAVGHALRALEPFARGIGAPAREAIDLAKKLSPRISAQSSARMEADKAETEIHLLCANQ